MLARMSKLPTSLLSTLRDFHIKIKRHFLKVMTKIYLRQWIEEACVVLMLTYSVGYRCL